MMIRNIFWDVDGTLFDTYPAIAHAFQSALRELGKDAGVEAITELAKQSLTHCLATLAVEHLLKEEDLNREFDKFYSGVTYAAQAPFPGAKALCEYICSVGGKNVIVTHRGRNGTVGLLDAHAMTPLFSGWITREDGYPRKPDPAAFEAALRIFGLPREETLTVGDRDIDIQAGKATGISTCLFGGDLAETTADLSIHGFHELYRFMLSRNKESRGDGRKDTP